MFKKISLLAMAVISVSAFAQSDSNWNPRMSGSDLNWNADNHYERWKVVKDATSWLTGGDRYYWEKTLSMATGPQEHALIKGLYNVAGYAHSLRNEAAMARMNAEWPTYAWNRTTMVSTTTDTTTGTTTTTTTTTTTPVATSGGDMMVWDTSSDEIRPLRMAYEMQKPRMIDYHSAFDILASGLDSTEQGVLASWWMNAPERSKDIVVRLIGRQLDWVDILPLRTSMIDQYKSTMWNR